MKVSVVIVEGAKQIMMTPETEHEKQALKFINPEDKLEVVSKLGSFTDERTMLNVNIEMCKGEYLRAFTEQDSLMFLIRDTKLSKNKENEN